MRSQLSRRHISQFCISFDLSPCASLAARVHLRISFRRSRRELHLQPHRKLRSALALTVNKRFGAVRIECRGSAPGQCLVHKPSSALKTRGLLTGFHLLARTSRTVTKAGHRCWRSQISRSFILLLRAGDFFPWVVVFHYCLLVGAGKWRLTVKRISCNGALDNTISEKPLLGFLRGRGPLNKVICVKQRILARTAPPFGGAVRCGCYLYSGFLLRGVSFLVRRWRCALLENTASSASFPGESGCVSYTP